ncbi:MAG: DEAD/DEAH box helicase [Phycisphaerales bacterium]|nr:DEAD/DEAH box helicase [Phycisphaerales bacterium]
MSTAPLNSLYNTPIVADTLRDVDTSILKRRVVGGEADDQTSAVARLRVAAIASFSDLIGDRTVDEFLRDTTGSPIDSDESAVLSFRRWDGYLDALAEVAGVPSSDDLLFFSVSGYLAGKPHEVRDVLRRPPARSWLDAHQSSLANLPWLDRVRGYVSVALVLIIRQDSRGDIEAGGRLLRELASFQRDIESGWLAERHSSRRDALTLLSLYHLAEATICTSEFLLGGSVTRDGRVVNDVLAELRRLLVRAEEFLTATGDEDARLWLTAAAVTLVSLRSASVWIQSRGISERIDRLLHNLTESGRAHPVFSLLPSQQEALRQAVLDRTRLAIVLQMPTSAGKTLLAEFAIVQTFDAYRDQARVVYLTPTRALATQVRRTLSEDLGPLGIRVSAAGSAFEEDPYELKLLNEADGVVVATPEKLDLMLRAHSDWFGSLRLIVVDEAHLLNDGERGVRLELLLANLRREVPEARLLLLTPFMDNAEEIARWLSRERGHSVNVQWRPARVILGVAAITGQRGNWSFEIKWDAPFARGSEPKPMSVPTGLRKSDLSTTLERVLFLGRRFESLGTVLALFSASPAQAEMAAGKFADGAAQIPEQDRTPQLKLAISLARHEFGLDSRLVRCLERGVAYHHSSLSPILRYLVEDQIRARTIRFVAATSTLAQGMNFPVASVVVHSIHKPRGGGNFSSAEFWNIAGRAGRVGMVEQGVVLFANQEHSNHCERYANDLRVQLGSALLAVLPKLDPNRPLKEQYRDHPALRPFVQYLAHAAANSTTSRAIANLEELIQQSLANQQVRNDAESRKLRTIARAYLQQIATKTGGMLKAADVTGLATFSFDELYAKLRDDPVLSAGPSEIMRRGEEGLYHLIDALRWLPELNLAIGSGEGEMDVGAVASVVRQWIDGRQVHEIADQFPGSDTEAKRRKAAQYLYGTVSQTMSWGTHAYLRGWLLGNESADDSMPDEKMLPAYMQYGVCTPEAAVASLLGVPRPFATAFGAVYRERFGQLTPDAAENFRTFVEQASTQDWREVTSISGVEHVDPDDVRKVYRQMQGI